jgi:hypothetical protein
MPVNKFIGVIEFFHWLLSLNNMCVLRTEKFLYYKFKEITEFI